jgi:hypothetical protein
LEDKRRKRKENEELKGNLQTTGRKKGEKVKISI